MKDVKYVMVSKWRSHWDKLNESSNSSTLFPFSLIYCNSVYEILPKEIKTLFIKKNADNEFEKAWIGISKNFQTKNIKYNDEPAIRFDVSDLKEIDCPIEFKRFEYGWHKNPLFTPEILPYDEELMPAFFKHMSSCTWKDFEVYCSNLLKLLGIHDLHAYPLAEQQGRADGFFKFNSLSVIYDATLDQDFEEHKKQQIENYINQLKKEAIQFDINRYTIKGTQRQVWIITRGSVVRTITNHDHIQVKEIPYTRLIEIYKERLSNHISTEVLRDKLKDLN